MTNLLTSKDVKMYEDAAQMIVTSVHITNPQSPVYSPEIQDFISFLGGSINFHVSTLEQMKKLYEKFDCRKACKALNELRIDKDQLEFSQKALGLEEIAVSSIHPEGQRAFFPLAALFGVTPEFNRLYICGKPSNKLKSMEKQFSYLADNVGMQPDAFCQVRGDQKDTNYFSFKNVGEGPLASVYVLLERTKRSEKS